MPENIWLLRLSGFVCVVFSISYNNNGAAFLPLIRKKRAILMEIVHLSLLNAPPFSVMENDDEHYGIGELSETGERKKKPRP